MKRKSTCLLFVMLCCFSLTPALAAPDFSGTWILNTSRSKNIGMMSAMQITLKIEQTGKLLTVHEVSKFNGQEQTRDLRYDLTGKTTPNDGPMGDPNQTVTKWAGETLITTWTQEGAVAGSKIVRTETRWLSDAGKTMTDQYVRGNNPPMLLIFEKQ
ncbi:MAG TPA: hypothetical protein VFA13_07645 [Candidatus Acidoferrum sp.]|jgi:hypothetical protein|nr:hypothetical protein [Candidatus Acidoferrum sp.]